MSLFFKMNLWFNNYIFICNKNMRLFLKAKPKIYHVPFRLLKAHERFIGKGQS